MVMKVLRIQLISAVLFGTLLIVGASCEMAGSSSAETEPPKAVPTDTLLAGPAWQLLAFEADGDTTEVRPWCAPAGRQDHVVAFPPFRYSLRFTRISVDSTKTLGGDGCFGPDKPRGTHCLHVKGNPNEVFFTYAVEPESRFGEGKLTAYLHRLTAMPLGPKEPELLDALEAATRYEVDGDRLRVAYGEGKALLFADAETFCGE